MILRYWRVAAALVITLLVAVVYGTWMDWDWKAMAGWHQLVEYIGPNDATGRKDAVQVYAVIVAGVIASITAAVGLLNLRLTRKNLEQQRDLEAQRAGQQRQLAQGTALQAYYEQIGKLLTDSDLRNTEREEIRQLARGQTLTVRREVDGNGKGSLLIFLQGAGLIRAEKPVVRLFGADLRGADLEGADLEGADLRGANLEGADLYKASLQGAKLSKAKLKRAKVREADFEGADLREADLYGAIVTETQLAVTRSLRGATMPDGSERR